MEFKSKSGNWSINLPFLCNKCGLCCTLDDFLTAGLIKSQPQNKQAQTRVKALYHELGELWVADPEKYDQYITHTPCPFLSGATCSIYEIRPEGCRQYPNTLFGMQTMDCEPLNRFKQQQAALNRGRASTKTYHFITQPLKSVQFSVQQYQRCVEKLVKAGVTKEESALFEQINNMGQDS